MNQIYETETKGKYKMLVGKTGRMWKEGKTPEEISEVIKQPIDKVKECIEYCKVADDKKYHNKSKNCTGCKFNKDKDTCSNPNDCDWDKNRYYTGYEYRKVINETTIADIFNSFSQVRKKVIYSMICNDEKLSDEEFLEKYKNYI